MKWISSRNIDLVFILTVGIWSTVLAYTMDFAFDMSEYNGLVWLFLVVGVDVSHVYSSLYRTYLSSDGWKEYKKPLIWIPVICFIGCFSLAYFFGSEIFWHVLVYIAVFHFIRQQIGFLRIYNKGKKWFDETVVYVITGGAIAIWHLSPDKPFRWFIKNDFFIINNPWPELKIFFHGIIILAFLTFCAFQLKKKNWNALLLVTSTFFAWYFGLALAKSDFVFTVTNVLTHGIPYMALVWHTQKSENKSFGELQIFLSLLVMLAFIEEALWDSFVWRDHGEYFSAFYFMPQAISSWGVALALTLLILPQLVHYVLDGFIWKTNGAPRSWSAK